MQIVCVGGGPAGLYFAILSKLREPDARVSVYERNPAGITFGWGVTFSDDVLDSLYAGDPVSAKEIQRNPASWRNQIARVAGRPTGHMGGYGFAIGRHVLLKILAKRARELGVEIYYDYLVDPELTEFADADLILASDGVNSAIRQRYAEHFSPSLDYGGAYYAWLGATKAFPDFTYAFEPTEAGWIWFHAYPFDAETSTFIPEATPKVWHGLGFDSLEPKEATAKLEKIFAKHLDGAKLLAQSCNQTQAQTAQRVSRGIQEPWLNFAWITNKRWYHRNIALAGDAAHTAHFSIGNGTMLAFDDALELNRQLRTHPDIPTALAGYEAVRSEATRERVALARKSADWFEHADTYLELDLDPVRFAYALRNRRGPNPTDGVAWLLHRVTQYGWGRWTRGRVSSPQKRQKARDSGLNRRVTAAQLVTSAGR